MLLYFFFQAEDGIRDRDVTGVQTCALPISPRRCSSQAQRPGVKSGSSQRWADLREAREGISGAATGLPTKRVGSNSNSFRPFGSLVAPSKSAPERRVEPTQMVSYGTQVVVVRPIELTEVVLRRVHILVRRDRRVVPGGLDHCAGDLPGLLHQFGVALANVEILDQQSCLEGVEPGLHLAELAGDALALLGRLFGAAPADDERVLAVLHHRLEGVSKHLPLAVKASAPAG